MKTIFFQLKCAVVFLLLFTAINCKRATEESVHEQPAVNWDNLIVGKWKMSGNMHDGVDAWNLPIGTCQTGISGSCIYSIPECMRDDIIEYKGDNSWVSDLGVILCDSSFENPRGTYQKSGNQIVSKVNQGSMSYTVVFNILQLDATTLKIQQVGESGYETYTRQ